MWGFVSWDFFLFPAPQSVTYPFVNFMPVYLFPCQSVCFLLIGLFPNCRSIFCLTVYFRTVGSVSCPSPDLPVGLFPVRWSVSRFSACFLSLQIGLLPTHQPLSSLLTYVCCSSVCFLASAYQLHLSLLPVHWLISCLPDPVSPSVFPYLGQLLVHWPVSCLSFGLLQLSACRFSVLSSVILLVCWYSVFPVNYLYPGFLPLVLFLGSFRWKFFKSLYQYSCSC